MISTTRSGSLLDEPNVPVADIERLSPDERARIVSERSSDDLGDLDPEFRARVEATRRRLVEERGLLDPERR